MSFWWWNTPSPVEEPKRDVYSVFLRAVQALEKTPRDTILAASLLVGVVGVSIAMMRCVKRAVLRRKRIRTRALREQTPETEATAESIDLSTHFVQERGRLVRRSPR